MGKKRSRSAADTRVRILAVASDLELRIPDLRDQPRSKVGLPALQEMSPEELVEPIDATVQRYLQ